MTSTSQAITESPSKMRREKELGFFERVYNATIELGFKEEALEA